ncbi:MAG: ATP-binding protein [Caldilineae bacterium]|nr:MAG: ATP-binding protein [Caldilineae bacterium]
MNDFLDNDSFLEDLRADVVAADQSRRLGVVVAGSLSRGLEVRLDRDQRLEDLAVGRYVTIAAGDRIFFGMITDVSLDSTNPAFEKTPPDFSNEFFRQVHMGTSTFGRIHVSPMLVLHRESEADDWNAQPVKTIPGHYSSVCTATAEEVGYVFGREGEGRDADGRRAHYFHIGEPLDMENVKITLNLDRFVERSSAVFGKSGTGKTFLSRLLLAGIIQNKVAVNLVFDMHNEYGWEGTAEHAPSVKGLKQLFPGEVTIFTLDDESSRRRESRPDYTVTISPQDIEPEDVQMLAGIIGLTEPQVGAMYALARRFGKGWLQKFLDDDFIDAEWDGLKGMAEELGQPQQTLAALRRRLDRFRRYDFITDKGEGNSVERILEMLQANRHVVLEFGRYGSDLGAYLLVANYLTRRIHERYVHLTERAFGEKSAEPTNLVITIEEAHKFLEPAVASHTIFGTIARELRKYHVTLLIVDQRPSGIDPEVMSQVGTRVTLALDSEEDIRAVFMGVSGASELRQVLARLDSREQALVLGHAVPMPVVVRTRRYDQNFWAEMGWNDRAALPERGRQSSAELRGERPRRLE